MSDDEPRGGGPGCIVAFAAWAIIVAGVLYAGFGWDPQEAMVMGGKVAGAIVCGIPLAFVAILLLIAGLAMALEN